MMRRLRYNFYKMDAEQLHEHQQKQLGKIIKFAIDNSPYYHNVSDKYDELPLMNKQIMMDNFDKINTMGLLKSDLLEFSKTNSMNLYAGKYSVGMSSGTSGNKGLTVLGPEERDNYTAVLFTRKGFPDGVKGKRILFALRRNNPSFMEVGKFGIKIVYVDYTVQASKIIEKVNNLKLTVIAGPPSLLIEIAKLVDQIDHRIEVIISYAEVLSDDIKNILEESFKAAVVQIYQGSEGFIASTCRDGFLHINEDLIYLELEKYDDKVSRVIITDLYRTTQPILRYELNDILEIDDERCICGSVFRRIRRIHGRSDDIFILKDRDGNEVNLFPDYVRRSIILASDNISNYQAIQLDHNHIEIRFEYTGDDLVAVRDEIVMNIRSYCDKLNADIPNISFSNKLAEKNINSNKMIRIKRDF